MKKVMHKLFWVWEFEKEEQWLNEQAEKGLALTSVGFCRYVFEDCTPGEYKICMEYFADSPGSAANTRYVDFLEETGVEHVGNFMGWGYFRKQTFGEEFQLFSDSTSRIQYLDRVIRWIAVLAGLNLFIGMLNVFLSLMNHGYNFVVGTANLMIAISGFAGIRRLRCRQQKLKEDQQLFE